MPTYEYQCKICGNQFEIFQSMADEPLKVCPECGKEVRRVIYGGGGIIFKGKGFYATDKAAAAAPKTPAAPCASCPKADSGGCPAAGSAPPS